MAVKGNFLMRALLGKMPTTQNEHTPTNQSAKFSNKSEQGLAQVSPLDLVFW
jgi:hypothetical protein